MPNGLDYAEMTTVLTHPASVCCQAEIMRSQRNRDGQWKYTEGCIDPDLVAAGGGGDDDDGPPDMSMPPKKKKPVKYEPVAFRPGDIVSASQQAPQLTPV